jgi:hypothetical protein
MCEVIVYNWFASYLAADNNQSMCVNYITLCTPIMPLWLINYSFYPTSAEILLTHLCMSSFTCHYFIISLRWVLSLIHNHEVSMWFSLETADNFVVGGKLAKVSVDISFLYIVFAKEEAVEAGWLF